jgi:hypothetical protein
VEDLKPWLQLLRAFMDADTEMTDESEIAALSLAKHQPTEKDLRRHDF